MRPERPSGPLCTVNVTTLTTLTTPPAPFNTSTVFFSFSSFYIYGHIYIYFFFFAQLSTNTTVVMSYGRIEVSVKLPKAQGLWPSIWMLPNDSPYGSWPSGGAINIVQGRNEMSRTHAWVRFFCFVCLFVTNQTTQQSVQSSGGVQIVSKWPDGAQRSAA